MLPAKIVARMPIAYVARVGGQPECRSPQRSDEPERYQPTDQTAHRTSPTSSGARAAVSPYTGFRITDVPLSDTDVLR
jgi:hypothetical protein